VTGKMIYALAEGLIANVPLSALRTGAALPWFWIKRRKELYSVLAGVLPFGLDQRPRVVMAWTKSLQDMGSLAPLKTWSAASTMLGFLDLIATLTFTFAAGFTLDLTCPCSVFLAALTALLSLGTRFLLTMIDLLGLPANHLAAQDMSYLDRAHKQGNC